MFDDVERKLTPAELAEKSKRPSTSRKMELNDEKPIQSLAEVYETEFQKQKAALDVDPTVELIDSRTEEQKQEHEEIDALFRGLCVKLDALSNWHYTPKPPKMELCVVSNTTDTPAIQMEEVTPAHVSDAQTLAPQEIFEGKRSVLDMKSQEELTTEEKRKLRRQQKTFVRKEQKRREKDRKLIQKMNPGLGNKYTKEKAIKELKANKVCRLFSCPVRFIVHASILERHTHRGERRVEPKAQAAGRSKKWRCKEAEVIEILPIGT